MNWNLIAKTIILVTSLVTINYGLYQLVLIRKANKRRRTSKNMQKRKFSWKRVKEKLIEPEENHLFGEIFSIIGAFLMAKWLENIIPSFKGQEWLFLGIGFIFVLYGVRLLRKNEQKNKKG